MIVEEKRKKVLLQQDVPNQWKVPYRQLTELRPVPVNTDPEVQSSEASAAKLNVPTYNLTETGPKICNFKVESDL